MLKNDLHLQHAKRAAGCWPLAAVVCLGCPFVSYLLALLRLCRYVPAMPVQSAFTYLIIGGTFCAASALIGGLNYLYEGKRQRTIGNDHWRHHLQERDLALEYVLKVKREKGI
jgi:hypothetical protein